MITYIHNRRANYIIYRFDISRLNEVRGGGPKYFYSYNTIYYAHQNQNIK